MTKQNDREFSDWVEEVFRETSSHFPPDPHPIALLHLICSYATYRVALSDASRGVYDVTFSGAPCEIYFNPHIQRIYGVHETDVSLPFDATYGDMLL